MRRWFATITAVLLLGGTGPVGASAQSVPPLSSVPGEVVVQLTSPRVLDWLTQTYGLRPVDQVDNSSTYELAIVNGTPVKSVLNRLRHVPSVISAEPDYMFTVPEAAAFSLQADPKCIDANPWYIQEMYVDQWSAPAIGLQDALTVTNGWGITIAVVDTGVQTDHSSLAGHLIDGYDFVDDGAPMSDPTGGPDSGHGTFIAGLIALAAPGAQIMPIRILDTNGQADEIDVANGIYFAVDHGANIINLSLGSYLQSAVVDSAVSYAEQQGVLVIAAAGNDNTSKPEYPAATSGVIGVAATDSSDSKASFSNFGSQVVVSAPGTNLYSTFDNGAYAFGEGTSFAAPLVASVAALAWSAHPYWGAWDLLQALTTHSANIDGINPDYAGQLGAGRIDAVSAVNVIDASPVSGTSATPRVWLNLFNTH